MDHDDDNNGKDNKKKSNGEEARAKVEEEKNKNDGKEGGEGELPLMALNHVSRLCRNVKESIDFYTKVLGFVLIERPAALDFDGAWLFNYGVGIHLVQTKDKDRLPDTDHLDPMDNHISFQCEDMEAIVIKRLEEMGVKYMMRTVDDEENGTTIDQPFFNDPDGFMIEICN